MRNGERVVADEADGQRGADAHGRAYLHSQQRDFLIRPLYHDGEVWFAVDRRGMECSGNLLHRQLSRLRPARESANAVGDAEQHRLLVEEKAVFIFAPYSANI